MAAKRKTKTYETGALEAIESGIQEIAELAEEMRSWYDNMPENLQGSDRGCQVEEAADMLEQFEGETLFQNLTEAIEECEGRSEELGCPLHIEGQSCPTCKWDGKARQKKVPELVIVENPKSEWREFVNAPGRWEMLVASCGHCDFMVYGENPTQKQIEAARKQAQNHWEFESKPIIEWNEKHKIPPRKPFRREVLPIQDFDKVYDLKVTLPAGKRKQSKAYRLEMAINGISSGISEIKSMIEADDEDERIQTVLEALDELENATSEIESVEFPGMYG